MNVQTILPASMIAIVLLLAGAGCGKKTVYSGPGGTVTEKDGELRVTNDSGETAATFTSDRLPENFPKDIPIFPEAVVDTTGVVGASANVSLKSKKPASEAVAWYKNELVDTSWNITSEYTADMTTWISAQKDDGSSIILTVGKSTKSDDPYQTAIGIIKSDSADQIQGSR